MTNLTPPKKIEAPVTPKAATQVAYPWKATLRTVTQVVPALVVLAAIVLPIVYDEIEKAFPGSPVLPIVAAAIGAVTFITALFTRIMAVPQVNEFLTKLGLGATPKK